MLLKKISQLVLAAASGTGELAANHAGASKKVTEQSVADLPSVIVTDGNDTRLLQLTDASKFLEMTNDGNVTITVPINAAVAIPVSTEIAITYTGGNGTLSVQAEGGGVTVRTADDDTYAANEVARLKKMDTNIWLLWS